MTVCVNGPNSLSPYVTMYFMTVIPSNKENGNISPSLDCKWIHVTSTGQQNLSRCNAVFPTLPHISKH